MDENKKLGQDPAFGFSYEELGSYGSYNSNYPGISKRFYAVCAAMQGILSGTNLSANSFNTMGVVQRAYEVADELLKQENQ